MKRPTRRAFVIAGTGLLLVLAGSTAQAGWLFVLAAGVFALVAASAVFHHGLSRCEVSRSLPATARVGDPVRVGLRLRNTHRRALPLLLLEDRYPAFAPVAVVVEPLGAGEEGHVELVRTTVRRGIFSSGQTALTAAAPFGLVESRRTLAVTSRMVVVPRWVELTSWPILEPSSFPSDLLHERARTGAGEEYRGVRDYRPGDPRKWVHWRSSARAGRLIVREFEEEVATRVSIVLVGPDAGSPPDSAFEALVSAAASVSLYALVTGHPVEVIRGCPGGRMEQISEPERAAVLEWLARAEPCDGALRPLVRTALERVGRRGTIVMFVPTRGRAAAELESAVRDVQSGGSRAIVVAARSSTWDDLGDTSPEEARLLATLSSGRSPVKTISRGEDLAECLQA